ncbi:MAG TPA: DsbA family protein [Nanoarchaeota archaeon]|nr:DsbA family protein [Nanoarchaeota archaeon]
MEENNEQIMELKKKLIHGEITLEEYNSSLREYEKEEIAAGAESDEQEEAAEATEEAAQPVHNVRSQQRGSACECPQTPYTLYALIGVLALLLVVSVFTNGFGLRATGDSVAEIAASGLAAGPLADPSIGPADAKVTIVEYSDFECPFCQRAEETVKQVLDEYEGRVRLIYRNYPLKFHNNAQAAAEAGELANEQGKFWEMHDKMFENRLNLKESDLKKYAEEIGLDMGRFNAGLESEKYKAEVDRDIGDGNKLGVDGVPAFFINGKPLIGAQPVEEFRKIIDEELAK